MGEPGGVGGAPVDRAFPYMARVSSVLGASSADADTATAAVVTTDSGPVTATGVTIAATMARTAVARRVHLSTVRLLSRRVMACVLIVATHPVSGIVRRL
ncbi:hypothetical protein AMK31_31155 [Streptomyces sp. TSRI0107]|nr:hypothetical protein AMK31_31155 [Streptomyces sp. TSRI0107]